MRTGVPAAQGTCRVLPRNYPLKLCSPSELCGQGDVCTHRERVSGWLAMKTRRDWAVVWYAAVLVAALAWGYVPPAGTELDVDGATVVNAGKSSPPANRLELRRVAQQMVLR
jgi:hypothetical protein